MAAPAIETVTGAVTVATAERDADQLNYRFAACRYDSSEAEPVICGIGDAKAEPAKKAAVER